MQKSFLSLALALASLLTLPLIAQAALYAPGQTLDPACAPTDPTCGVATSTGGIASGTATQVPYYAASGTTLSATSSLTILQNGNVGVGTTSPGSTLSVAGSLYYTGSLIGVAGGALSGSFPSPTLRDFTSIMDYGAVNNVGLVSGTVTTTSGLNTITMSGLTSADIGKSIVSFTPNTTNEFQSTITAVNGTTVTLANTADVTASGRSAYWGTDSTAAIDSAFAAVNSSGKCLYIPAGNYFYSGNGDNASAPCIYGEGQNNSTIFLGVGKYFVNSSGGWYSALFQNMHFYGGAGGIRNTDAGTIVQKQRVINNVAFDSYSACAVSFNSPDEPYITVTSSFFSGLNTTNSMGLCINGNGPSVIQNNSFINNRVHVKLGNGGSWNKGNRK